MLAAEAADFSRIGGGQRIGVAVSGGADSTALLFLAREWAISKDIRVLALTFDHQLRVESADEAQWVAELCGRLEVAHKTLLWEHNKPTSGIQAKARNARYSALTGYCRSEGVDVLLTGHTLDDQAETVAMRMKRTRSPASLAGIWPERDWGGVRLVRPLLGVRRADLRRFLSSRGQDWLEDPSNRNPVFERVRVRSELSGADLEEFGQLAKAAQLAATEAEFEIREWLAQHAVFCQPGYYRLPREEFSQKDSIFLGKAMFSLANLLSGGSMKTSEAVQNLGEWLNQPGSGRRTVCGVLFVKQTRHIFLGRELGRIDKTKVQVPADGSVIWDQRFSVKAPAGALVTAAGLLPKRPRLKDVPGFVCDSLPAVVLADGSTHFPVSAPNAAVSANLMGSSIFTMS